VCAATWTPFNTSSGQWSMRGMEFDRDGCLTVLESGSTRLRHYNTVRRLAAILFRGRFPYSIVLLHCTTRHAA